MRGYLSILASIIAMVAVLGCGKGEPQKAIVKEDLCSSINEYLKEVDAIIMASKGADRSRRLADLELNSRDKISAGRMHMMRGYIAVKCDYYDGDKSWLKSIEPMRELALKNCNDK